MENVSLGTKITQSGRSVMYQLMSEVVNGDKHVLNKLDEQINVIEDDSEDENDDIDYKKVSVDYQGLIDKDSTMDNILKDLLDLPIKSISKMLHHPVFVLFIEKRWLKTKWMFLINFISYFLFLFLFSTFLGLMYFRTRHCSFRKDIK